MKIGNRFHVILAVVVVACTVIAGFIYWDTAQESTYNTLVTIIEGGVAISLSYLLVILYRQQREIQEEQLKIAKNSRIPDVQVDLPRTELNNDDGRIKFIASNHGGGPAKNMVVNLNIEISTTPEEFDYTWTPENGGREHLGQNYLSEENSNIPFWIDTTLPGSPTRSNVNRIKRWIFRRTTSKDRISVTIRWLVEYKDRFGNSDSTLMASSNTVFIKNGCDIEDQIRMKVSTATWNGLQSGGIRNIRNELLAAGLSEDSA